MILGTLAVTAVVSLWVSGRMAAEQDAATGPRRDWDNG